MLYRLRKNVMILLRENHDSISWFIHFETYESGIADELLMYFLAWLEILTLVLFSKTSNASDFHFSVQDNLLHFQNKLQEPSDFLEQPIVVSSAINELRKKTTFV